MHLISIRALEVRQTSSRVSDARKARDDVDPDVSRLATFCSPLRGAKPDHAFNFNRALEVRADVLARLQRADHFSTAVPDVSRRLPSTRRSAAQTRNSELRTRDSASYGRHLPLEGLQPRGEQQNTLGLQGWPAGIHVAACAGVGAMMDVTTGTATAAAMPSVRTI